MLGEMSWWLLFTKAGKERSFDWLRGAAADLLADLPELLLLDFLDPLFLEFCENLLYLVWEYPKEPIE